MKTKLEPLQTDQMPREVATAILLEPKAKLTNAFRKTCQRARETVYSSATPLVSNKVADSTDRALYSTPPVPEKESVKLHSATMGQLGKWLTRCKARRIVVQKNYVALAAKEFDGPKEKARQRELGILELQAKALDAALDSLADEVTRRAKLTPAPHRPHIDPNVRRRAAIRALVAGNN